MLDPRTQHDHKSSTIKKSAKKITHLPQFQNNRNCTYQSSSDEILQFRPNNHQELNSSSDCSPLLWKINPSPNPSPGWCPSPGPPRNSRRKAIANGQRELMEMVKNMPESSYELSLRDLVEHHRNIVEISNIRGPQVQNMGKDRILQRKAVFMKMQGKKGFEDNRGLFLKMGFQFNSQSKRIKKIGDSNKSGGRVLAKPERDWRKKKLAGWSDSESSGIRRGSGGRSSCRRSYGGRGSTGGSQRENEGILTGCWQLFQSRNHKSGLC